MNERELSLIRAKLPISEDTIRRNLRHPIPTTTTHTELMTIKPTTDEAKLNKTEAAFLAVLQKGMVGVRHSWVGVQNITLKLADDTRYTPDFFGLCEDGNLIAYEVKGFFRDDAKVKIKVAARMFPWIRFVLVRKEGGQFSPFKLEEVKP